MVALHDAFTAALPIDMSDLSDELDAHVGDDGVGRLQLPQAPRSRCQFTNSFIDEGMIMPSSSPWVAVSVPSE